MEDALKELDEMSVDLVITDIFMPGIGGIEGITMLKIQAPEMPVIAMSGGWDTLSPDESVNAAVKIGARGGLAKPIKPKELKSLLDKLGLGSSDTGDPVWPQTPNKTPDWDAVFDAPGNGLTTIISKLKSFDLLKISASNMLNHIMRKPSIKEGGEDTPETYKERLQEVLKRGKPASQPETLLTVVDLFSEIRDAFKEEDARQTSAEIISRVNERKNIRKDTKSKSDKKSRMIKIAIAGGIALTLLAGAVVFFASDNGDEQYQPVVEEPKPEKKKKSEFATQDKDEEQKEKDPNKQPPQTILPVAPYIPPTVGLYVPDKDALKNVEKMTPDWTPTIALSEFKWPLNDRKYYLKPVRVVPLLRVRSSEILSIVCNNESKVVGALIEALSTIPDEGRTPSRQAFNQAAKPAINLVNRLLGTEWVQDIIIISNKEVEKFKSISGLCRLISPKDVQGLDIDNQ